MAYVAQLFLPSLTQDFLDDGGLIICCHISVIIIPSLTIWPRAISVVTAIGCTSIIGHPDIEAFVNELHCPICFPQFVTSLDPRHRIAFVPVLDKHWCGFFDKTANSFFSSDVEECQVPLILCFDRLGLPRIAIFAHDSGPFRVLFFFFLRLCICRSCGERSCC